MKYDDRIRSYEDNAICPYFRSFKKVRSNVYKLHCSVLSEEYDLDNVLEAKKRSRLDSFYEDFCSSKCYKSCMFYLMRDE